ncbi:MAG: hypothetical protein QOH88_1751 [Verrucomicrobiota bacterium]|jgi:hypothetical protein
MLFRVASLRDYDKAIDAADGELQNPWKDWQMPQAIETDNGRIFGNAEVQHAIAKQLDIQLVQKAKAPPTEKGKIERFFKFDRNIYPLATSAEKHPMSVEEFWQTFEKYKSAIAEGQSPNPK